jgi:predicted SAM-dependent methyltransferase
MKPENNKLNMGCGFIKLNDHWNVDISPVCNPDEVFDLENTPYPWEDNFFKKITANNILEHLGETPKKFTAILKEMYRISADQAEWTIMVPHHRCDLFYDDYTHIRTLTPKTFRMFDQKVNFENIGKISDSTFGIFNDMDLEVTDYTFNIISYWQNLLDEGMLGSKQFNINLNTMSNVVESTNIFIKVHKPGRCQDLVKNMAIKT